MKFWKIFGIFIIVTGISLGILISDFIPVSAAHHICPLRGVIDGPKYQLDKYNNRKIPNWRKARDSNDWHPSAPDNSYCIYSDLMLKIEREGFKTCSLESGELFVCRIRQTRCVVRDEEVIWPWELGEAWELWTKGWPQYGAIQVRDLVYNADEYYGYYPWRDEMVYVDFCEKDLIRVR